MSTDCIRYIEVKIPVYDKQTEKKNLDKLGKIKTGDIGLVYESDIHYYKALVNKDKSIIWEPYDVQDFYNITVTIYCININDLPTSNIINENTIFKTDNESFYIYKEGKFSKLDNVEYIWKPVWNHSKNSIYYFCTSANNYFVANNIYNHINGGTEYVERGLPNDVSKEIQNDCEDTWGKTYLTLNEIEKICQAEIDNFKHYNVELKHNKDLQSINHKLDLLLNKEPEPIEENCEDEEEWYDKLYTVIQTNNELNVIREMVNYNFNYISSKNIRVIYCCA